MTQYNPNIHHRRSIRLKGYDYARKGLYFITLCVQNREPIFGDVQNGKMILNPYGEIACQEWQNTQNIRNNVALHECIVMPNHFHAIIEILFNKGKKGDVGKFKSPSQTLGSIIRGYKIAAIKKIKDFTKEKEKKLKIGESDKRKSDTGELQFAPSITPFRAQKIIKELNFKIWQRNYHEHIIRNNKAYQNISKYIINNPKKWEEDKFYKH